MNIRAILPDSGKMLDNYDNRRVGFNRLLTEMDQVTKVHFNSFPAMSGSCAHPFHLSLPLLFIRFGQQINALPIQFLNYVQQSPIKGKDFSDIRYPVQLL